MKTVTLPIEEYDQLVQDKKDKQRLMEEMQVNADERGYLVRYITQCWKKDDEGGWLTEYEMIREKNTLKIISKDEVLAKAQKELDRLEKMCEEQSTKIKKLERENLALRCRGFWARVFNRED